MVKALTNIGHAECVGVGLVRCAAVDLQFDSKLPPACSAGLGSVSHGQV